MFIFNFLLVFFAKEQALCRELLKDKCFQSSTPPLTAAFTSSSEATLVQSQPDLPLSYNTKKDPSYCTWQAEQAKLLAQGPESRSQTSSVILNNPSRLLWELRKGKPRSIETVSCLCNCLQLCLPKARMLQAKKAPQNLTVHDEELRKCYI